jgi:hypothetical protein
MKKLSTQTTTTRKMAMRSCALLCATLVGLGAAGCAGASNTNTADNPGVAGGTSSAQYNTYVGTQSVQWSTARILNEVPFQYGGVWDIALDDSSKFFNYENVGHQGNYSIGGEPAGLPPAVPVLGSFTGSGFLSLTANGSSTPGNAGYALEISGQAALFRPGNDTMPPVVAVESSNCLTLTAPTTYQFISLGSTDVVDTTAHVAYGSVTASTSGITWNFSNLQMFGFDGTNLMPTPLPAGGCGETAEGFAISIAPSAATNNVLVTTQVSPSGFFIMDQGQGEPALFAIPPTATDRIGLVGVQQPSSQLVTSKVVAAKYLGFEYDGIEDILGIAGSLPVSFGTVAGTGTTMTGGGYANDDVTQIPATNITIDLGAQDGQNNGLYKSVTVTVPDTYKECIQQSYGGKDANGNPTCIYQGEAVVGNPGGKYAIFVTVNDLGVQSQAPIQGLTGNTTTYGAMDFFLYQQ